MHAMKRSWLMAWGPQPYKGMIFVADMNSGLWIVRLEEPEETLVP